MILETPDEALPTWLGIVSGRGWQVSEVVSLRMAGCGDSAQLMRSVTDSWQSMWNVLDPVIPAVVAAAADELLAPWPQASEDDRRDVIETFFTSYLTARVALGTDCTPYRYSASLGLLACGGHLKSRVQRLSKEGLTAAVPPPAVEAALVPAMGTAYEVSFQPTVADDLLDGLFVGIALTGLALAVAEFELAELYLGDGLNEILAAPPSLTQIPTDWSRPVQLSDLPFWFREMVSRATNPNQPRVTSSSWTTPLPIIQTEVGGFLRGAGLFPGRIERMLRKGKELEEGGLAALGVIGVGAVLGPRLDDVSALTGAPPEGLIEEITRQSSRCEWPHFTDEFARQTIAFVYEMCAIDFPFRPKREHVPISGSYKIVRLLYPSLPDPIEGTSDGGMMRCAVAMGALGYFVEQRRSTDGLVPLRPSWRWLQGDPVDPSWA